MEAEETAMPALSAELLTAFLRHLASENASPHTIDAYCCDVSAFFEDDSH